MWVLVVKGIEGRGFDMMRFFLQLVDLLIVIKKSVSIFHIIFPQLI